MYAAEVDAKVLVKLGPGDFSPPDAAAFAVADRGHNWVVWERQ